MVPPGLSAGRRSVPNGALRREGSGRSEEDPRARPAAGVVTRGRRLGRDGPDAPAVGRGATTAFSPTGGITPGVIIKGPVSVLATRGAGPVFGNSSTRPCGPTLSTGDRGMGRLTTTAPT